MLKYNMSRDFEYYKSHQDELVAKYNGRYIVIANEQILGTFNLQDDAINAALKKGYKLGNFLVQLVGPGKENYTKVLSRVKLYA